nr:PxKF domain-containing protein [Nocardioidaceae bacterium]
VVDTGDPTISHSLSGSGPNSNGWYNQDVTVTFHCDDSGSGVQSCVADGETGDSNTLGEGANQSVTGTATDWAGNTETDTVSGISIDKSAPNAPTASLAPAPNGAGWNNTDVLVSFAAAGDNGPSGVDTCTTAVPVSAETAGQTVTGTCTDKAGNVSAATQVTVKLDKTGPTISDIVTVAGTEGTNGWYTTDVEVTFTATDALSGPATATKTAASSGEGTAVSVGSPAFTDTADNTTPAGAVTKTFKIDKTAPNVSLVGGPSGSYYFGNDPAAPTCDASDALSGLDSCVVTGGGTSVGSHTYTATATDNAGNKATAELDYTVLAWELKGFYSPVDMAGVWNTVKGGSTVPLKFEVFAGANELTSTSTVQSFKTQRVSCTNGTGTEDAIEFVTTGGTSLRYDSTGGQFIQNWKTPTGAGSCYATTMTTLDGSSITALFKIK